MQEIDRDTGTFYEITYCMENLDQVEVSPQTYAYVGFVMTENEIFDSIVMKSYKNVTKYNSNNYISNVTAKENVYQEEASVIISNNKVT